MRDPEEFRYKKKAPKKKPFGIESWSEWFQKWHSCGWYPTEKQRDQAFEDLWKKTTILKNRLFRKVTR
jgi:hypothetical protein